jgi:hypothetical protein
VNEHLSRALLQVNLKKGAEMNSLLLIKIAKIFSFFMINNFQIYINVKNREEDKVVDLWLHVMYQSK